MQVKDLIKFLQGCNPEAVIRLYRPADMEAGSYEEIDTTIFTPTSEEVPEVKGREYLSCLVNAVTGKTETLEEGPIVTIRETHTRPLLLID